MLHQQPLVGHIARTQLLPHRQPPQLIGRNHHPLGSVREPWLGQIRRVGAALRHFERHFNLLHFEKSQVRGHDRPRRPIFDRPAAFEAAVA